MVSMLYKDSLKMKGKQIEEYVYYLADYTKAQLYDAPMNNFQAVKGIQGHCM